MNRPYGANGAPDSWGGRVLAIGGWGRCGSTLLDMMLGQLPNVVSAGELREIWLRGCVENRPCGCGEPFLECPFWTKVGDEAFGGWNELDVKGLIRTRYTVDRPWGIPPLLLPTRGPSRTSALGRYVDALARLFAAIRFVSGCDIVVDSSKIPSHGQIVSRIPGVDMSVVHLVRDSRGVAYSASKRVEKVNAIGPPTLLPRYGPFRAAGRFAFYNGATVVAFRNRHPYLLIRYEDLVSEPERHLREVMAHVGEPVDDSELSFLNGGTMIVRPNHLVEGNPVRLSEGPVRLRVDDAWRRQMNPRHRRIVTALTLPFLASYGYRIRA